MKIVFGFVAIFFHVCLAVAETSVANSTSPIPAISTQEAILGQVPPEIVLSDKKGGFVQGDAPWNSATLKGKVSVLFYVAPAQKELNAHVSAALREAQFPAAQFQSYAVVNMAASSWPNFMIESKLKASQEEFPRTLYVKDKEKVLVSQWKLEDHANNVVAFDKTGTVIFLVKGKVPPEQVKELIALIRSHL